MATQGPPAGWHPDPYQPGRALRWWDGTIWSEHTRPLTEVPVPSWGYVPPAIGPQHPTATPSGGRHVPDQGGAGRTFPQRNSLSLTTLAVVAAYILLATATHVVLIGILPVGLSIRALSRREQLAPVALVAAIVAVVVALSVLTHH